MLIDKYYNHFLFCLFVILFFTPTQKLTAQTYSLSGQITDEQNKPVKNAEVIVTPVDALKEQNSEATIYTSLFAKTKTDKNGRYKMNDLAPDRYLVTIISQGKQIVKRSLQITDKDKRLNIKLSAIKQTLDEVTVSGEEENSFDMTRLKSVENAAIYDAKKSEVIQVEGITANMAANNSRQIYGKVAGLNIWQSDGAGVQLGLGGRGLSPNRNANFNTRQNGYDISADALGYPESYYTPPTQALERIEIIRGASSLQYGTQFGGMVNFVFKDGAAKKPIQVTSTQSGGSFGLFSSFNSVGGTVGKLNYYTFYQYKRTDGWRPNSDLDQHTAFGSFNYKMSERLSLQFEYTFMYYLQQQPGGLTDAQFEMDPSQSTRERNWFSVNWNLMSFITDYKFSSRTNINSRFFGLIASRDAVGNLSRIDRLDFGGPRDLLKDNFRNWGNETRLMHRYNFLDGISVLLVGARYYDGFTWRREGDGTAGSGPNFKFNDPNRKDSDFDLPSQNVSLFAENVFNITPEFSITPGARFEFIKTKSDGFFRNEVRDLAGNLLVDEEMQEQRLDERSFVFFGIGMSYKKSTALEVYANISQNYRAVNFNDIRVDIGSLEVDPDIDDERGFSASIGARGTKGDWLNYDVSLFHISYDDRIGSILKSEPNPQFNNLVNRTFRFRTNVADANIYGIESFAEVDLYKLLVDRYSRARFSIFSNISAITSEYVNSQENGVEGNEVEQVPPINLKTGFTFGLNDFESTFQYTYVGEHFSDATNARRTPTAIEGIIPSYQVMDLSFKYQIKRYQIETGVNNITDSEFFTRRATGYPGPGIIPAQARSFYLSLGVTF